MPAPRSDALALFGATGDLAHKKIFPALQALIKRGHLDAPVIGIARSPGNVETSAPTSARAWRSLDG